jgi:hypothetical protein
MASRDNTADEIAVLKAAQADLERRLAATQAQLAERDAILAAARDPYRAAWAPTFARPSDDELASLLRCVRIQYPTVFLEPTIESVREDWRIYFKHAFIAVSWMPRHPEGKLALGVDSVTWQERAKQKLQNVNLHPDDIGLNVFMAAILAHGDVKHTFDPSRGWHDLAFAFGNEVGRFADGSAWRKLLGTRVFLPPLAFPVPGRGQSQNYPTPQFRVTGGGGPANIGGSI